MNRIMKYHITDEENKTIFEYLREKGYSKSLLIHLKQTEHGILVNNIEVYTNYMLKVGDCLTTYITETESSKYIIPIPMKLDIIYEDKDFIVISKPVDMPIHPSQHNFDNSLANGLMYYYKQKGEEFVYRCVNRLDRNTTGLLIVAKNMLSASLLSSMVKQREIERNYLAFVEGKVPLSGMIEAPIARVDSSTKRSVNFKEGKYAKTYYKKIDYNSNYNCSLVQLKLETGRTHQIRVHMSYIGHPLLGDELYGGNCSILKTQALHCYQLKLLHPITKKYMKFHAIAPENWNLLEISNFDYT